MPPYAAKQKKHPVQHEQRLQLRICNQVRKEFPGVIFYCDFAAGLDLNDTQRQLMMAMRSHDGMPDFYLDRAMTHTIGGKDVMFHGLRVEIKKDGTRIYKKDGKSLRASPYSRRYIKHGKPFYKRGDHLAEQAFTGKCYIRDGYFFRFGVGEENIMKIIRWYMKVPQNTSMF